LLGGTTTVVCSGGGGLLLLTQPDTAARNGTRISVAMAIVFMALSFRSLLQDLRDNLLSAIGR
jgi:hypothetical protein